MSRRPAASGRSRNAAPSAEAEGAAEQVADRIVHRVGVIAALAASARLIAAIGPATGAKQIASLLIYCVGLNLMLAASAAYNGARPGRLKARLRALDHAAIFVMIAASYTPFALDALEPRIGLPLCAAVWAIAAVGCALKLARIEWSRRVDLALYLGMGWLILAVLPWLAAALPAGMLALLLAGGVVYSLGSIVQARRVLRFRRAIWHALVLVGAGLHWVAVSELVLHRS